MMVSEVILNGLLAGLFVFVIADLAWIALRGAWRAE